MKKRKWSRKVAWIFGVTAVCTLGLVLLKDRTCIRQV